MTAATDDNNVRWPRLRVDGWHCLKKRRRPVLHKCWCTYTSGQIFRLYAMHAIGKNLVVFDRFCAADNKQITSVFRFLQAVFNFDYTVLMRNAKTIRTFWQHAAFRGNRTSHAGVRQRKVRCLFLVFYVIISQLVTTDYSWILGCKVFRRQKVKSLDLVSNV